MDLAVSKARAAGSRSSTSPLTAPGWPRTRTLGSGRAVPAGLRLLGGWVADAARSVPVPAPPGPPELAFLFLILLGYKLQLAYREMRCIVSSP